MWTTGQSYIDAGCDYYENRYKERVLRNITRRARELGYDVVLQPIEQGVA
jgi:transposase